MRWFGNTLHQFSFQLFVCRFYMHMISPIFSGRYSLWFAGKTVIFIQIQSHLFIGFFVAVVNAQGASSNFSFTDWSRLFQHNHVWTVAPHVRCRKTGFHCPIHRRSLVTRIYMAGIDGFVNVVIQWGLLLKNYNTGTSYLKQWKQWKQLLIHIYIANRLQCLLALFANKFKR